MQSPSSLTPVAHALPYERAEFIRRVYGHLAGAVACFIVVEFILLHTPIAISMFHILALGGGYGWLLILGAFGLVTWFARSLTVNASPAMQYTGLGIYIVAEALIFLPLLLIAIVYSSPTVLPNAAILTAMLFIGLTAVVFLTRQDFSFLAGILSVGGMVALGLIICGVLFGFNLGLFFSGFMVALASAAILYDTSKVLNTYTTEGYVAAATALFASVMLLFWYILRILMRVSRR